MLVSLAFGIVLALLGEFRAAAVGGFAFLMQFALYLYFRYFANPS